MDGRKIKLAVAGVLGLAAGIVAWQNLGRKSDAEIASSRRVFICEKCGKWFPHDLVAGETIPIPCEECGAAGSAYQAEKCFYTSDGQGGWKAKVKPTYVLVKDRQRVKCPDCGHDVEPHNPPPPPELMEQARAEAGH